MIYGPTGPYNHLLELQMTKRKNNNYEETLREFSLSFKKHINEDIKFWRNENPSHAKGREMAYSACLNELKEALEKNNLTLSDVALAGYKVPEVNENND